MDSRSSHKSSRRNQLPASARIRVSRAERGKDYTLEAVVKGAAWKYIRTPWGLERIPIGCAADRPTCIYWCDICFTAPVMEGLFCGDCFIHMKLLAGQLKVGYNHD